MAEMAERGHDENSEYLGDGLYVSFDGYQIRLYAHNGLGATNEVWLEPSTLSAFKRYIENLEKSRDQE